MPSNEPHNIIAVDPEMYLTVENCFERPLPESLHGKCFQGNGSHFVCFTPH